MYYDWILRLLGIGWITYTNNQTSEAPSQSTTETKPNSSRNTPAGDGGSVTEDGNANDPATPSPSGTGANNLLSQ